MSRTVVSLPSARISPTQSSEAGSDYRANRILAIKHRLETDFSTPPGLAALAQSIGLNRHSLCREFKRETGLTISQYLQLQRVEAAERLLLTGKWSVTEAALEVGYNSLSAFSRAYLSLKGHCPCRAKLRGGQNLPLPDP
jgi:AraC-like DNA-binding protein